LSFLKTFKKHEVIQLAMNGNRKILAGIVAAIIVVVLVVVSMNQIPPPQNANLSDFPDFYTKNEDYYITRIDGVPSVNRDTYRLEINGLVDNPRSFTLEDLQALNLTDLPLTIECIGNTKNGKLVSTAIWRGFNVYDLLDSLGISESATGVKYTAADGYYASHTMDQLQNNGVLGALYMNGVELPPVQGFPLRILNPGYYGIKQPAWVTGIEVIDTPLEDYWQDRGWDTSPPIDIDSKIFFPTSYARINVSESLRIGGCAFGGTRVKLVEYTTDDGTTWHNAPIIQQIDADNVWVFWEVYVSFSTAGSYSFQTRATDINNNQQVQVDLDPLDGTSSWPLLIIDVT
jgi:DMSO/TMAO reductase YedYZ molybdopterin-dependent catalytic subunit